ncbi:hypothetical protein AB0I81_08190 [Nonomuraea sp. NPDC050404]|uniref:hypothetical protein n=1 Tax=Nonomuraea sp. NPDC050404 TaxID=3155783 RepID=UPI0033F39682
MLDDITRLRMHRADDQDVLDQIRAFLSMHVTLVLVGVDIPGSGLLREGRHDRRAGPRHPRWRNDARCAPSNPASTTSPHATSPPW